MHANIGPVTSAVLVQGKQRGGGRERKTVPMTSSEHTQHFTLNSWLDDLTSGSSGFMMWCFTVRTSSGSTSATCAGSLAVSFPATYGLALPQSNLEVAAERELVEGKQIHI